MAEEAPAEVLTVVRDLLTRAPAPARARRDLSRAVHGSGPENARTMHRPGPPAMSAVPRRTTPAFSRGNAVEFVSQHLLLACWPV